MQRCPPVMGDRAVPTQDMAVPTELELTPAALSASRVRLPCQSLNRCPGPHPSLPFAARSHSPKPRLVFGGASVSITQLHVIHLRVDDLGVSARQLHQGR